MSEAVGVDNFTQRSHRIPYTTADQSTFAHEKLPIPHRPAAAAAAAAAVVRRELKWVQDIF